MPNRLAAETSPYLLQHADNPVEWWPWGEAAFAEARTRDVPVLLSIGYAACHWCHVMAHESFESAVTAAVMNRNFVCVKVDREERPDVDAVYMEATQAMTGHGGWPMTCFLTPTAEPFFCGTYFPPADRPGMPGFPRLLESVATAWRENRDDLAAQASDIVRRLGERAGEPSGGELTIGVLDAGVSSLAGSFDGVRGGFGGAPKFPPSMCLEFLLRAHHRSGAGRALEMVATTCEAMARGGMYDQLGGGFARYSVDADWVVPHFEKMLYDNALLLRVYLHWWRATGDPLAERVCRETAEFIGRDLGTPEYGFASAWDADSEGEEGRFYVWTPDQVGPYVAQLCDVTATGTFEDGRSVLQLRRDPDDPASWASERGRLFDLRAQRVPPARDDKVVAAWNGLAIAALAETGALLDAPEYVVAARDCARLLIGLHWVDGRLRRTSRDGVVGRNAGVLDDYGCVADGLLALYQVTGEPVWVERAGALLDVVLDQFVDQRSGGFFDTADDSEVLVRRPQDLTDNATPSGSSAAAGALLTYAALTGSARHRDAAERAVAFAVPLLERHARFVGHAAAVGEALLAGPLEVAIVGDEAAPDTALLISVVRAATAPGLVLAVGDGHAEVVPLLRDRPRVDGRATAYVCRGFVCQRPVTDPDALRDQLAR